MADVTSSTEQGELLARLERERAVLEGVNRLLRETLACETINEVAKMALAVAEELSGSRFGYVGRINSAGLFDTYALSDPGWKDCDLPEQQAGAIIMNMTIDGLDRSTMREGRSRIVNDPPSHPESKGVPEGHPPITSFLGVPLKEGDRTVGMFGLGNKPGGYDEGDRAAVEALAVAVVEAFRRKDSEIVIAAQAAEMLELSTPVMQVWPGIVVAPLVGTMDSDRTYRFMERLLEGIVETRSEVALVDITGVPTVDTRTAQHLMETVSAVRLLGAKAIVTGISPGIAQTMVSLGVDMGEVETSASLATGLRSALAQLGLGISDRTRREMSS